ncbi:LysR family transcriptional regulator [Oceaniserpentilla sp. 4NH20-0058]|uniref:LysR family transcriptional regulator n=1 Tax=Oceaniserpentilla sp. 4NH20-0058 TaxID=3127660 RepID=UPI0031058744
MKIDLNLFTVFEAIYSEGSLTRAAARLNLTQPAISHALGRLRDRLDDPLFVRHGHKMRPTPLAQNLLPDIQAALAQLNQAIQHTRGFEPAYANKTFTLAMRDVVEARLLPPLVTGLSELGPNISAASVTMDRKNLEAKLASGEWDFAFDVLRPSPASIKQLLIMTDDLVVLKRVIGEPLKELTQEQYLEAEHIVVSTRPSGPGLVDYSLSALGLKRNIALRCQHYFAACQVVDNTDLWLTMPKVYATILADKFEKVELLPIPFKANSLDVYLYWHSSHDNDSSNKWFRQFIHELASNICL